MKILIVTTLIILITSSANAYQGCIKTTEDGQKRCSQIMSSSSCKGPTSSSWQSIDGKKVIKAEPANLKKEPRSAQLVCVGKYSGDKVKY